MTPRLGDVDYREPGQALVCGGSFEKDEEAVQCIAVAADEARDAEAEWIAGEIERLVASGRYDYGDIVVLMRSPRARLHDFEEVFKAQHIPYYSDNSVGAGQLFHLFLINRLRGLFVFSEQPVQPAFDYREQCHTPPCRVFPAVPKRHSSCWSDTGAPWAG